MVQLHYEQQGKLLLDLFNSNNIPFYQMENMDAWVSKNDYCFAQHTEVYVGFLKKRTGTLNLSKRVNLKCAGTIREREEHFRTRKKMNAGNRIELNKALSEMDKDGVVLLTKQ